MKKVLSVLLAITLLAGCFAACNSQPPKGDSAATPTAVEPTKEQVEDVVAVPEEQEQETENKQQAEENQEPQESVAENKPATEKKPQKQETAKQEKPVVSKTEENPVASKTEEKPTTNQDAPIKNDESTDLQVDDDEMENHPMIAPVDDATFTTEEAFLSWLKGDNSHYFTDSRTSLVNVLGDGNKLTYRRPAIAAMPDQTTYKFSYILVPTAGSAVSYHYRKPYTNKTLEIRVMGYTAKEFYEIHKEKAEKNVEWNYSTVVDGITYYYVYNPDGKVLGIMWKQFGEAMLVFCKGVPKDENAIHQKVQELIPLIKVEQVTINLNSDHVVK